MVVQVVVRLVVALFLVTLGTVSASAAGTFPLIPDPSECQVAPRSIDAIQALLASTAATPEAPVVATPFAVPDGEPADAVVTAGITATSIQIVACSNAGDFMAVAAIYTDRYLRNLFASQPLDDATLAFLTASPVPFPPEQRATLVALRDIRVLAGGRVGAFVDVDDPNGPPDGPQTEYTIYVAAGDRYVIDEAIPVDPPTPSSSPDAAAAPAATLDLATLEQALQTILDQHVANAPSIPGLLVSIQAPGLGLDWSGAAGVADRTTGEALTAGSTFRIASNTKTFTAAATLRLVEDARIGLDQPIADLLSPESIALLTDGGYDPRAILVRHLLRHTSGLYDYAEDPVFQDLVISQSVIHWTRYDQVRFAMEHGQPVAAPGVEFHYSDTGYVLLGEIIERASGLPLAAAYRELLDFTRLGLNATYLETLEPAPRDAPARAHQYFADVDTTGFDPSFDLYGGGGLVSSTTDLGQFYQALLNGEVFQHDTTLQTMLEIAGPSARASAAMGLFWNEIDGQWCWQHDGFWGSTVLHCPDIDVTLVFSINQAQAGPDFDALAFISELFALVAPSSN